MNLGFEQIILLLLAAAAAGWVDAVVGGGGLIQLPALMLVVPQPVTALATNKVASVAGTSTAAIRFSLSTKITWRVALPAAVLALCSSGLGALAASSVPSDALRPAVLVVLIGVALVVTLRPNLGSEPRLVPPGGRRTVVAVLVAGVGIAFYDGIFGPGTGTFLVLAFAAILGTDFVHGSAMAKIVNCATNLGALLVFAWQGHVLWGLGLGMAVFSIAGAQLGAHMALRRGTSFVRVVLLCVVTALVLKLGYDQLA